jgi:hypothetical protein
MKTRVKKYIEMREKNETTRVFSDLIIVLVDGGREDEGRLEWRCCTFDYFFCVHQFHL